MKIYIAFSNTEINNVSKDDLVIGHSYNAIKNNFNYPNFEYLESLIEAKDYENNVAHYNIFLNSIINAIHPSIKEIVEANRCNLYSKNISPILLYFIAIDKLIERYKLSITEIVISDFINSKDINYYEAEGESNKMFLYEYYNYIPYMLKKYVDEKYKSTIQVNIHRRHYKLNFFLKNFTRRYIFLLLKFAMHFKNRCLFIFNQSIQQNITPLSANIVLAPSELFYFVSSRSTVASDYMANFLFQNKTNSALLINERFTKYFANYHFIKANNIDKSICYHEQQFLQFWDIFKIYFKVFGLLFKNKFSNSKLYLNYGGVNIDMSNVLTELIISSTESFIYEHVTLKAMQHVNNKLHQDVKKIAVSLEMLTDYSKWIKKNAEKLLFQSIQIQTTVIASKPFPDFIFCDYFLFNNKSTFNYFENWFNSLKKTLCCFGNVKYGVQETVRGSNNVSQLKKVLLITQPIDYENQFKTIELLLKEAKKNNFELYLKIHPRDNAKNYESYSGKLKIVDNNLMPLVYLKQFDLAIMKNSSLGMDCFFYNLPTIYYIGINEPVFDAPYIDLNYYGLCKGEIDLINKLNNYEKLVFEFNTNREIILDKCDLNFDETSFKKLLTK
jgi:hypothetical protein